MADNITDMITVEVAYALPQAQVIISLTVNSGTTALEAIELSGILQQFPAICLTESKIGIFGKITPNETVLKPMDRVEIYRPLIANAKEARRLRATAVKNKTAAKTGQPRHPNRT